MRARQWAEPSRGERFVREPTTAPSTQGGTKHASRSPGWLAARANPQVSGRRCSRSQNQKKRIRLATSVTVVDFWEGMPSRLTC